MNVSKGGAAVWTDEYHPKRQSCFSHCTPHHGEVIKYSSATLQLCVQDGSLVDLLEQQSKEKAHLPIQDVLSIFFQVAAPSDPCVLRRKACLHDQTHDQ
jgi:hypothetical protein